VTDGRTDSQRDRQTDRLTDRHDNKGRASLRYTTKNEDKVKCVDEAG